MIPISLIINIILMMMLIISTIVVIAVGAVIIIYGAAPRSGQHRQPRGFISYSQLRSAHVRPPKPSPKA